MELKSGLETKRRQVQEQQLQQIHQDTMSQLTPSVESTKDLLSNLPTTTSKTLIQHQMHSPVTNSLTLRKVLDNGGKSNSTKNTSLAK
jgi:ABC-type antimicrobial peptide transport system ATPase subunit